MQQITAEKKQLRTTVLQRRRSLSGSDVAAESSAIAAAVTTWRCFQQASVVMAFAAMPDEPQTTLLMEHVLQSGKTLCLPQIGATYGWMEAAAVDNLAELQPDQYGILGPAAGSVVITPNVIDLIIVPAVAFTVDGQRLGMGAGFYDRFLARARQAVTVGIALSCQLVDSIPCDRYDKPVGYLATKTGLINCQTGEM